DVSKVAGVASFFVSRIDGMIDTQLEAFAQDPRHESKRALAQSLQGRAAIANAKIAYAEYEKMLSSKAWQKLAKKGAMPQRLLWASTSTKNPRYRDVLYAEELIGADPV